MNNKEKILELYFDKKYIQKQIASELNVSTKYVSKILLNDSRYQNEKLNRKLKNQTRHKQNTANIMKQKRHNTAIDREYEHVKKSHNQATFELSDGKKIINNKAFRDWNPSIYRYNEKSKSYVLKSGVNVGADVPKKIKWKI